MEDDNNDLFDGTLDDSGSPDGSGDGTQDPPAPQSASGTDGTADPSAKRIADLMSRAQKAEAEAAKYRKQLGLKDGRVKSGDDETATQEPDEFQEYLRESAKRDIFRESGLADFGLDVSVISGATLREMKESADRWKTVAASLASKARQEAFAEAGVTPDTGGGQPQPGKSFAEMSEKEFEEFLRERDSAR